MSDEGLWPIHAPHNIRMQIQTLCIDVDVLRSLRCNSWETWPSLPRPWHIARVRQARSLHPGIPYISKSRPPMHKFVATLPPCTQMQRSGYRAAPCLVRSAADSDAMAAARGWQESLWSKRRASCAAPSQSPSFSSTSMSRSSMSTCLELIPRPHSKAWRATDRHPSSQAFIAITHSIERKGMKLLFPIRIEISSVYLPDGSELQPWHHLC